ncbi:hypothetical protein [Bacillus wiedmannii]|uniref:hypothetical protein n=1 Tax=Bacillus wiedmannii TaxID=1890302 RepID=UPI000BF05FA5|nr:hypothetical protein [Bacillus wiedmannii]PEJ98946.1 hypothetical protein CN690_19285 [Bacillus wiedmannii]PEP24160.1 hypothetical protein CN566_23950 [Bacillus wiedmannii]PFZ44644.1 hypothetical protein COL77_08200 [Bacillus wiedmannii]PGA86133.1 hypothetical protein COL94_12475 [Bacillus wiedmannii]PHF53999.1 hypothetical protein COI40_28220 [Bacillus wiedmannii]
MRNKLLIGLSVIVILMGGFYFFYEKILIKMSEDKAPRPSILIKDMSKRESNAFHFTNQDSIIYNQIFWNKSQKEYFYPNEQEISDIDIDKEFGNKKLQPGVLPKNYELSMTYSNEHLKPSFILGKIKDEEGNLYNWKQEYSRVDSEHNYLIHIPEFKGNTAKVFMRNLWLNNDGKCYGVLDQLIYLKKE